MPEAGEGVSSADVAAGGVGLGVAAGVGSAGKPPIRYAPVPTTRTIAITAAATRGHASTDSVLHRRTSDAWDIDRVRSKVASKTRFGSSAGAVSSSQLLIRSSTGRSVFIVGIRPMTPHVSAAASARQITAARIQSNGLVMLTR